MGMQGEVGDSALVFGAEGRRGPSCVDQPLLVEGRHHVLVGPEVDSTAESYDELERLTRRLWDRHAFNVKIPTILPHADKRTRECPIYQRQPADTASWRRS